MIYVAASLYGAKKKYTDGALKVARSVATWTHPHFVGAMFVVYHDNTVPPSILQSLRNNSAVTIDKSTLGWKLDLRMFWRFLALCDYEYFYITDVDFVEDLHECLSRHADAFQTSIGRPLICGERGHRYHQERLLAFDGEQFGGCHLQNIGWDLPELMQTYVERARPLSSKGRVAQYYGNDEVFLDEYVRVLISRGTRIDKVSSYFTKRPVRTCVSGPNGTMRKIQLSNLAFDAPVTEDAEINSIWDSVL